MTESQGQPPDARGDFERFYTESVKRLVTVVYAVTGDLGEAEDAVQEAYARAWPRWEQLVAEGDPTPWVRTVALRLAVSSWRRTRNRILAHFRHGPPPDLPGLAPDHVALVAALRRLNPEQRRAVVLHHLLDLPVEEVARQTGSTSTAVRSRLMRARRVLSAHLTDSPDTPTARTGRTATAAQPRQEVLPHE
ncbi:SigE family RNA polymerase sigma factor [Streptomyces sp. NBC_00024]|uniref:SigE family RNA polymerase sigma factor n=1 Tax=Streptomyces sp. NBC_00024 TaxID=2903612 RepID=UPI00325216D1